MFFTLFGCVLAGLVPFHRSDHDKMMKECEQKPFVLGFHHPRTETKDQVVMILRRISDLVQDVTAVVVDCEEYFDICLNFSILEFPSYLVLNSRDPRLNIAYTGNYTLNSIRSYVEDMISPNVKSVGSLTDNDIIAEFQRRNYLKSVTVYYTNTIRDPTAQILHKIHKIYDRKLFIVDGKAPRVDVWISPYCKLSGNGLEVSNFVLQHAHSVLHYLTYDELTTLAHPVLAVVTQRPVSEYLKNRLLELSGTFCGEFEFGLINPMSDRRLRVMFRPTPEEAAYLAYIDHGQRKVYRMMKAIDNESVRKFIANITKVQSAGTSEAETESFVIIAFVSLVIVIALLLRYYQKYDLLIERLTKRNKRK